MTEEQCYDCIYYIFDYVCDFTDEWCTKDNEYFMQDEDCPNWRKER